MHNATKNTIILFALFIFLSSKCVIFVKLYHTLGELFN